MNHEKRLCSEIGIRAIIMGFMTASLKMAGIFIY